MILYGSSLSPFVRKVLAFAAEKGIEVELRPTGSAPGQPSEEFIDASPAGKMPALRDGDFTLADSSAIAHYFEALKPEPQLIPSEPQAHRLGPFKPQRRQAPPLLLARLPASVKIKTR
jgi:glutathione S-transferase